ncbi:MAG: serine acetyltransferase [Proteobacteria bacterium]|nr:serine acetyltransferase [Pseudomonadota bacterium]
MENPEPVDAPEVSHNVADAAADALLDAYLDPTAGEMQHIGSYELPSALEVERVIEYVRALLFPGYAGPDVPRAGKPALRALIRGRMAVLQESLQRQIYRALHHKRQQNLGFPALECVDCRETAQGITERFLARLPLLRAQVRLDLRAAYEGDPAASGVDEILSCYPGTYAVTVYRIANTLQVDGALVIPRMMTEIAHRRTGIDIHPGASIGPSFFIDHGTGVVIGETTRIGAQVRIYQGVTLGALTVPVGDARPEPGHQRHPTIEDRVVIYANATILGGQTVIGEGAVVGGNAFVTASVAPGTKVGGKRP